MLLRVVQHLRARDRGILRAPGAATRVLLRGLHVRVVRLRATRRVVINGSGGSGRDSRAVTDTLTLTQGMAWGRAWLTVRVFER